MKRFTVIVSGILMALALVAVPLLADDVDGPATFKAKCNMCHGPDGSGDTPMGKKVAAKDLRAPAVQDKTDEQLTEVVAKGKNKMPAFEEKLSAEQIKALIAVVRTFKK